MNIKLTQCRSDAAPSNWVAALLLALLITATAAHGQARAPKLAERELIAAVIIGESGGHGRKGMEAVYEVIHARASRRGTTCAEEVLRHKQFEVLNGRGSAGERATALWWRHRNHKEYEWVHNELLKWIPTSSHTGTNPYNRCDHYHATSATPYWAFKKVKVDGVYVKVRIKPAFTFGGHHWYNNIK